MTCHSCHHSHHDISANHRQTAYSANSHPYRWYISLWFYEHPNPTDTANTHPSSFCDYPYIYPSWFLFWIYILLLLAHSNIHVLPDFCSVFWILSVSAHSNIALWFLFSFLDITSTFCYLYTPLNFFCSFSAYSATFMCYLHVTIQLAIRSSLSLTEGWTQNS